MGQGGPKELVKTYGNAKLRKWPRKPKKSKWVKDAQKKINGTKEPTSNVIQSLNDHFESLKEE